MTAEEINALPLAGTPPLSPNSVEAEENLLACVLIDASEVIGRCFTVGVSPASFYDPALAAMFGAAITMHAAGQPVDVVTMAEVMQADRSAWTRLLEISKRQPTTLHAAHFTERVRGLAARREIIRLCSALAETARLDADQDRVPGLIARLSSIAAGSSAQSEPKWPERVADAHAYASRIAARAPEIAGESLGWPWPFCDRVFRPFGPGELVVLAARPSVGKSSMTRALCLHHAEKGAQVVLFTLEDSPRTVALQGAAARSRQSFTGLADAHVADQHRYLAELTKLAHANLHVFSQDCTLAAIAARAKSLHAQKPLALVAIDQLSQIADGEPGRGENKASALKRVTSALKKLARELGCPVLLPHQLNRESEKDGNRPPRLFDLRDSGGIEEDADRVLFLHRPNEDPLTKLPQPATNDAGELPRFYIAMSQGKGRDIGQGQMVAFYFHRTTASFDIARSQ